MKNIYKKIKELMKLEYFKSYRLMVTEDIIEIKLTPRNDKDSEINYSMRNTKHNIGFLVCSLDDELRKYNRSN